MSMKPSAKVICDSVNEHGHRLTTMEVVMHRFVLAEFNTHRVFSRNSASSRAIPVKKIMERVSENPALPVFWGANQSGMQAYEELDPYNTEMAQSEWQRCKNRMLQAANFLTNKVGLHKQITNRLLEPWMYHTAIVTATEWDNFFHQRCSVFAQPEIRAVADAMQLAYYTSEPTFVGPDSWHLPYIMEEDYAAVGTLYQGFYQNKYEFFKDKPDGLKDIDTRYLHMKMDWIRGISVARCARVSYLSHNGKREIEKDLELYDKLGEGMHWSPFEHVARPLQFDEMRTYGDFSGNFRGWKQYRKEFPRENQTKFIPNLPELAEKAQELRERYGITNM